MNFKIIDKFVVIKKLNETISFTNAIYINNSIIIPNTIEHTSDLKYFVYENEEYFEIFYDKSLSFSKINSTLYNWNFDPWTILIFKCDNNIKNKFYYKIDEGYIIKENSLELITSNFAYLSYTLFKRQVIKINISNIIENYVIFNYYENIKENYFSIAKDKNDNIIRYLILTNKNSNIYLGINFNYFLNLLYEDNFKIFKIIQKNKIYKFYEEKIVLIDFLNSFSTGIYLKNGFILTNNHPINKDFKSNLNVKFKNGKEYKAYVFKQYNEHLDISILKICKLDDYLKYLNDSYDINYNKFFKNIKYTKNGYILGYNEKNNYFIKNMFHYKINNIKVIPYQKTNYFVLSHGIIFNGNSGSPLISKNGQFLGWVFCNITNGNKIMPYILSIHSNILSVIFNQLYNNQDPTLNIMKELKINIDFIKKVIPFIKLENDRPKL